jgi:positive regulator of sigma E activity
VVKIPLPSEKISYSAGEKVGLILKESEIVKINLIWFGVPLLTLFLSLWGLIELTVAPTDWKMVQTGIIGMISGLFIAKSIIHWRSKKSSYWCLEK